MSQKQKNQKAYVGDVEFNIADLAQFTMTVLDCVMAVTTLLSADAGRAMRDQLLKRADVEEAEGRAGSAELLRVAASRFTASQSSGTPSQPD